MKSWAIATRTADTLCRLGRLLSTLLSVTDGAPRPPSVAVVIPTRSRPEALRRCLDSLQAARQRLRFPVYVCDSSPTKEDREEVRRVTADYEWTRWAPHEGRNVAAARNACARAAEEDLLVNVDDDLELEPQAIDRMVDRYTEAEGRRIVAGSVSWDGTWTRPVKKRAIGYGRPVRPGERPDFVVGALFLYPRSFALAWPWNERIDVADDIFIGALWRSHGVQLLFAPEARALHPELPTSMDSARLRETVRHQESHIYALLFDSVIANPSLAKTVSYETLGFLASAKLYMRQPSLALAFLRSWIAGHVKLVIDSRYLWRLAHRELGSDVP